MSVSGITSGTSGSTDATAAPAQDPSKTLGQDAFLKLLMAELQNQDPTKPMDDTAFITQMATFNSLEKLNSISTSTSSMDDSLKLLNQLVAASLLQGSRAANDASTATAAGTSGGTN